MSEHQRFPNHFMTQMRHTCDPLADAVAAEISRASPSNMLDEVIDRAEKEGGVFRDFLDALYHEPEWLDWELLEQGRQAMASLSPLRALSLLTSSLSEGYSLAKGAHVLVQTGRLNHDVSKRLIETGQMSHNMAIKDGLRPGGVGHRIIMEVRILHAMVRKFVRQKGWDVSIWDEPVNQEDMAFTIIEFDYLANRGIERMGGRIGDKDKQAMHHLWRYAAYLHGVDERLITHSYKEEIELYHIIKARESKPSDESIELVHNVIDGYITLSMDSGGLSKETLYQLSRLCLGEELANSYRLPQSLRGKLGAAGIKAVFAIYTFFRNHFPGAESWQETNAIKLFRKNLEEQLDPITERRAFRTLG